MIYLRNNGDDIHEKPIIVIEDDETPDSAQEISETPVITIENDDETDAVVHPGVRPRRGLKRWMMYALCAVLAVVALAACYVATRAYGYYCNIGVSVSVSPKRNIEKLESMKPGEGASAVTLKTDTVLGVALDVYELRNVKAELTLEEPDTADRGVLLYTRTADYTPEGKYIGSLVIDGEEMRNDVSRLGYCAISGGNMVIGISRFDDVKEYVIDRDGSYFRQFVLLSDGELPRRFFLHGKVERKALARTDDDRLYVVETCRSETLRGFAEALREYGFVDAVYLTGGNECGFYRSSDGTARFTEKAAHYRTDTHKGVAPWLVLRKR